MKKDNLCAEQRLLPQRGYQYNRTTKRGVIKLIGRVEFKPPSTTSQHLNWETLVSEPARKGNYIEAFAAADALIDFFIDGILRQIYSGQREQDLLNELGADIRGLSALKVLLSKTVIEQKLYQRVIHFKKARNLVSHDPQGEYALVIGDPEKKYQTQDELDRLVSEECKKWLREGFSLFNKFIDLGGKMTNEKAAYYFSTKFYHEYPRGKAFANKYPKLAK